MYLVVPMDNFPNHKVKSLSYDTVIIINVCIYIDCSHDNYG